MIQTLVSGFLYLHWVTNAKKALAFYDLDHKLIGKRFCSNSCVQEILSDLGQEKSIVAGMDPWHESKKGMPLSKVDSSKLLKHKLQEIAPAREEELAGKEWIWERFVIIRDQNGRQTDGDINWSDYSDGSRLIFHSLGVRHVIDFKLEVIEDVIASSTVQKSVIGLIEKFAKTKM